MRLPLLALLASLAACEGAADQVSSPSPETYSIARADLWNPEPQDICRAADPAFLDTALQRVRDVLPADHIESLEFHDFNVTDPAPSGEREANLRFWFVDNTGAREMWTANAPFVADECSVGEMVVGKGSSVLAHDPDQIIVAP